MKTPRTKLTRAPQRGSHDIETIKAILDEALIGHVAFVHDGRPAVIPTLIARDGDNLLLHGSSASRTLRALRAGAEACVEVTHVDGIVLARSAFHHSMNYRSAILYGTLEPVEDVAGALEIVHREARARPLGPRPLAEPARSSRPPACSACRSTEGSAKVRQGPPGDDDEDYALDAWAGVVPITTHARRAGARSAPREGIEVPEHVRSADGLASLSRHGDRHRRALPGQASPRSRAESRSGWASRSSTRGRCTAASGSPPTAARAGRRGRRDASRSSSATASCSTGATSPTRSARRRRLRGGLEGRRRPAVRAALVQQQQGSSRTGDWVAEGRDITTVVAPDGRREGLPLRRPVRARAPPRRRERRSTRGRAASTQRQRDERDSTEGRSTLEPPKDAVPVDTTGRPLEEVIDQIVTLAIEAKEIGA